MCFHYKYTMASIALRCDRFKGNESMLTADQSKLPEVPQLEILASEPNRGHHHHGYMSICMITFGVL
jgi:hypothetical protein